MANFKKPKPKSIKVLDHETFFFFLDEFIRNSTNGIRVQKNGLKLTKKAVKNYICLRNKLLNFSKETQIEINIPFVKNNSKKQHLRTTSYWINFYNTFTEYMYDTNCFDNTVGTYIKHLRTFLKYLQISKHLHIGNYYKKFYVPKDPIPIVSLTKEQLNYLIYSKKLNNRLDEKLKVIRDIFIVGCITALRISDILSLTNQNVILLKNKYYIKIKSRKTKQHSTILLPDFAVKIIHKYSNKNPPFLLPKISPNHYNVKLKVLSKYFINDFPLCKKRSRKGNLEIIYKHNNPNDEYYFSDHICSHTMRRTGITTMLNAGVNEKIVKQISGHSLKSIDFHRYIDVHQGILDKELDNYFKKLESLKTPNHEKIAKS